MIIIIPTVALIALISCSGKLCLEYLIMLKNPSIISQRPKPIKTIERAFNNLIFSGSTLRKLKWFSIKLILSEAPKKLTNQPCHWRERFSHQNWFLILFKANLFICCSERVYIEFLFAAQTKSLLHIRIQVPSKYLKTMLNWLKCCVQTFLNPLFSG